MQCPLCHSTDTVVVREYEVPAVVREWESNFQIDVREEFGSVTKFEFRKCATCGFLYFSPPTLAGSSALYAKLQRFDWYYMPRKWEHDVALKDLRGAHQVLEIGCGTGDFVALARSEAGLEMEGIELNQDAVQFARKMGRPVHLMRISELAQQSRQYEALCSFQVLEHLPDPGKFLEECCSILKPGGKLLLGVPNVDSFLRYQRNLLDLPPHHMSRWSDRLLHRIPDFYPLRMVHVKTEPLAEYHVEYYVGAYLSLIEGSRLMRLLCAFHVRGVLAKCLKATGLRKILRGQTLYVCYERT